MPKSGKRILSIKVKHMVDDSPDFSTLGEYTDKRESPFSIDRDHALDCPVNAIGTVTTHISDRETKRCMNCDRDQYDMQWAECENQGNISDDEFSNPPTTWDHYAYFCRADRERGEYQYFTPSFNYIGKDGMPCDDNTPEEVRQYTLEDYKRMRAYNRDEWTYIGIRVEAEVTLDAPIGANAKDGSPVYTIQHITSGGLWGIESDSGDDYIKSVEDEELSNLKRQLKAIGFSSRAVATAVKNITTEDE